MRILPLVLLAACGSDDQPTFAPVIDTPPTSAAAYPWSNVDSVRLAVAHAGAADDLKFESFARGAGLEITDVPFADDLVVHLTGLRGMTEVAYGRSCPVAVQPDAAPATPHLYFARTVRWASGPLPGPASPARVFGSAYTAPDGAGVFVGGDGGETTVDRFDTLSGRFIPLDGATAARAGAVIAPLPDGSALRIGGSIDDQPVDFFEHIVVGATTAQVERVDAGGVRVTDHAAATLVDGTVVVMGGHGPDGTVTGATWTLELGDAGIPDSPQPNPPLAVPRAGHTATRMGNEVGADVLVVGGVDATGAPVATAELWQPLSETYASFHPAMVTPRSQHHAALLPDGSILIVGGVGATGPLRSIEVYLPRIGQFANVGDLPVGAGVTDMTLNQLPDGRVLIVGGRDVDGTPVTTTLIARLDPIDGKVQLLPTDSLAVPRAGHASALLCDGTILVVGGTDAAGAPSSERYNPPAAGRR